MGGTTDQLEGTSGVGGSDLHAQLIRLTAEVAELRRQLHDQAQVVARLQTARELHCCPWWAQPWHREHTSRTNCRNASPVHPR